jgi:hypothetical protein
MLVNLELLLLSFSLSYVYSLYTSFVGSSLSISRFLLAILAKKSHLSSKNSSLYSSGTVHEIN